MALQQKVSLKCQVFPANFSKTPASIRKHAPKLGEHTVEILKEAGIDDETIEEMISSKATLLSD
jgi:Predicted acyl-CoA transferases/carnitine dehydratase